MPSSIANYRLLNYRLPPKNLLGVLENIITKWACKNTKQLRRPASCYYAVAGLRADTALLPCTGKLRNTIFVIRAKCVMR